jgi:transposase-like protein
MTSKAPGKHFRQGLSTKDFYRMFPDDASAEQWFIENRWFDGITCPRCGSDNVQTGTAHKTMPFCCRKSKKRGTCGKPFSVKVETFMEASNLGYQD